MAEKLKSIAKQIHWSLVLRAGIFALAWWWLPFWLFFLVALYLYCVPWFQTGKLAVPFIILLVLSFLQPSGFLFAVIFGAVFYLILLLKDLLVIDRRSAHELLALTLSFLLLRSFYLAFNEGVDAGALVGVFFTALAVALLVRNSLGALSPDAAATTAANRDRARVAIWLSFILITQILFIGLFLPLDFIYQLIIAFLVIVLVVDLVPEHLVFGVSRTKLLTAATGVATLFIIVLASARWGL